MLFYVFTVDGDWKGYFDVNLSEKKRLPCVDLMQGLIEQEIRFTKENLSGKFIHFVHSSPRARDFFLKSPFPELWRKIVKNQGNIGLHGHEDDPQKDYYFDNLEYMRNIVGAQVSAFRERDLSLSSYRGGYMAFSAGLIPVLKENNLGYDFSCEPQRYLMHGKRVVSDWRGSPSSLYEMNLKDHRRKGKSGVYEIPVGYFNGFYLYYEKSNQDILGEICSNLKKISLAESCDIIVSVLTHSWEFETKQDIINLKKKTAVLKEYGEFINIEDLSRIKGN